MRLRSRNVECCSSAQKHGQLKLKTTTRRKRSVCVEKQAKTDEDTTGYSLYSDDDYVPTATRRPLVQGRARERALYSDDDDYVPTVTRRPLVQGRARERALYSDDNVPTVTRRPLVRGRARKSAIVLHNQESCTDLTFKTPVRSTIRHQRVLAEMDPSSPRNVTARNIYTPIVRFLTPAKENRRSPGVGDVVMTSPEQCVFGYSAMGLLVGDGDTDEVFSPYNFVKNIPSQSQQYKPCLTDIPPKTRSTPEATLILDLDETLMFSSLSVIEDAEYTFRTSFQDQEYKAYVILRPHVGEFLQAVAKVYELFVYTSAKKEYAEKIVDILDPRRTLFRHRLYQEDCACVLGHYVKDLGVLARDLPKTVVLDNAPHTYPYHLMNTIPIKSWSGDKEDTELQKLIPFLERLSGAEDFREVLKRRKDHFHRLLTEY